ncbi:hypothetical protein K502DRAFT_360671 [Neoconidiobolus thromboides FSU 785]|nr:hypothetical protein K502DRAFT_360671 [Neoconidiobolus thromboides FSU 785]
MDGQVILIQANLIKDRFIKQKVIHTCTEKITGLGFSDYNNEEQLTLFIITTREILTYSIGNHEYKQVLDDQGCNLNCTSMVDNSFHKGITMARNDAFYFYDTEGRGPCLAFEGIKSSIGWYDTQLVILSPLMDRVQPYRIQDMISEEERQESKKIEIYDVTQKLIAYSYNFEQNIQNLCYTNNCFYILLKDGELIKIYEKEVQNKLEILLKQDLFQLSLNICQSNKGVDNKQLADIHKKFADFLYQKGEFDDAMDQYINTLAYLEPSYVIRKYLDGQRLQSLTRYLQALHNHPSKMANPDHTTLLLNCYTKLKEEDKIEQFINSNTTMELNFELEIGIKVLRQAQYFNQALELAKKYQQHDWCLKILIEDQCEYKQGYEYLLELSQEEQKYYVMEYGRILIKNIHDKLIQLLIQLSTENKNKNINPIEFISIFIDYPIYCILYLEQYVNIQFNLDLNNIKHQSININNNEKNGRRNSMNNKEETIIWDTLLELYLANFNSEILFNEDKKNYYQTLKNKILFILNNKKINYDINFAMVLCKQYSFDEGLILLFEKLEMYQDILNHYIKLQDVNNILETLRKYGFKEVYLYHLTLEYFSTSNHAILNYPIQFRQVLDIIEDNNIIPPLHVIQALSRNSIVTIGTLKPFILKGIKQDLNSIEKVNRQRKIERKKIKQEGGDVEG